jgi:hypothetical protein
MDIRAGINEMDTRETIGKSGETKSFFFLS